MGEGYRAVWIIMFADSNWNQCYRWYKLAPSVSSTVEVFRWHYVSQRKWCQLLRDVCQYTKRSRMGARRTFIYGQHPTSGAAVHSVVSMIIRSVEVPDDISAWDTWWHVCMWQIRSVGASTQYNQNLIYYIRWIDSTESPDCFFERRRFWIGGVAAVYILYWIKNSSVNNVISFWCVFITDTC